MDYYGSKFDFNLQRFAEVPVDLTNAAEFLADNEDGVKYVDKNGAVVEAGAENIVAKIEVASNGATKTVTIVAASDAAVTVTGATQAQLEGVGVKTMSALTDGSATKAATTVTFDPVDPETEAASVTVAGTVATDFTVSAKGITTGKVASIVCDNGVIVINDVVDTSVTVSVDGTKISGITAEGGFSVKDSATDGVATKYTVSEEADGKVSLTVRGDQLGDYAAVKRDGATITLVDGKLDTVKDLSGDAGAEKTLTPTFASDGFTLVAQNTATTAYYAIKFEDSKYTLANEKTENPNPASPASGVIGYAKVVTDSNMGEPTATVSFVATDTTSALSILGALSIDAMALTGLTVSEKSLPFTKVTVVDTVEGAVTLTGVTGTADAYIGTTKYTKDHAAADTDANVVAYTKTYSVTATATDLAIDLTKCTGATTYYFAVTDTDKEDHGKHVYSISAEPTTGSAPSAGSYFKVVRGTENEKATYAVTFTAVENKPADLSDTGWGAISLVTTGITAANTASIAITPNSGGKDAYALEVPVGVVVKEGDASTYDKLDITRSDAATATKTTLTIESGNEIKLLTTGGPAYYKIVKTDPDGTGNQTLTVTKLDDEPTGGNTDSYFEVKLEDGVCSVVYHDVAGIGLSGLKKPNGDALQIPLTVPNGFTNGIKVDITDSAAAVDYKIEALPVGTVVEGATKGKDVVSYDSATIYYNGVEIALSEATKSLTADGTVYYKVVADTESAAAEKQIALGYTGIAKCGAAIEVEENQIPENTENYIAIQKTGKTYNVSYHKAESGDAVIDLATAAGGAVSVSAEGLDAAGTKIELVDGASNLNDQVNQYVVTDVAAGGFTGDGYIKAGKAGGLDTLGDAYIKYQSANAFAEQTGNAILKLSNTTNIYYKVTATLSKGVTTYAISNGSSTALGENESGFKVVFDDEAGTATIQYVENGSGVTEEEFLSVVTALGGTIQIDATDMDTETYTTIVLTEDDAETGAGFSYNVSAIPTAVSVENATDGKDTLTYVPTYQMAFGTSLAVSSEKADLYYVVSYTGGTAEEKGVYTCTIGEATETVPTGKNYFHVSTSGNAVAVQYVQATGEGIAKMDLDKLTIGVKLDASVASNAKITFGTGASDDSITFDVPGLASTQNVALADSSTAKVSYAFEQTDKVDYPNSGTAITLGGAGDDSVTYYVVTTSGGATSGTLPKETTRQTDDVTVRGITTYTLALTNNSGKDVPETGTSYIAVTHGKYITTITYVNGAGIDLSAISEQIAIDASDVPSTVDTIDLQNGSGAVKYNVTGLTSTDVKVTNQGDGDTTSYRAVAVKIAGAIELGTDTAVNYLVASDGTLTEMEEEPAASDNYVSVKKSGTTYTVSYTPATEGAVYSVGTGSEITVDASEAGKATIINNVTNLAAAVENAVAGATVSGSDTTISYTAGFAWAEGVYYLPVATDSTDVSLNATAEKSATATGGHYLLVKVEYNKETKAYTITKGGARSQANATTGVLPSELPSGSSYTGKVSLVAPSEAVTLVATGITGEITGIASGSVLTEVDTAVTVTSGAMTAKTDTAEGGTLSINGVVYTSGGTAPLSVLNGKAVSGSFVVSGEEGTTLSGSGTTNSVTLKNGGEVVATFEGGVIASLTGLSGDEQVKVVKGGKTYDFALDGAYIKRYDENAGTTAYAAVSSATGGNVLAIDDAFWAAGKGQQVGQAVDLDAASATAYITIGTDKTADVTVQDKAEDLSTAEPNTYYVKAVTANDKTLSLSIVKGNAQNLVDPATDYTGTITANAEGATSGIKYSGTTETGYKVAFTNVAAGSTFTGMDDGDTITTASLGASGTVTVNDGTSDIAYKGITLTGDATNPLTFTGTGLTSGSVTITGNGSTTGAVKAAYLSSGETVSFDDATAGTAGTAVITAKEGKVTSIKELNANETVTITTDATTTTYTTTDGLEITRTVKDNATGAVVTATATIEAGAEVLEDVTYTGTGTFNYSDTFSYNNGGGGSTGTVVSYFKANATATPAATVTAGSNSGTMTKGDYFVKATAAFDKETGISTLTLAPMVVNENGAFVAETGGALDNQSVTVTLDGSTKVSYTNSTNLKAQITGAVDGSAFTMKNGETVTTIASFAADAKITVNDTAYVAGASTQIVVKATNTGSEVESGALKVASGTIDGTKDTLTLAKESTVEDANAGVVATYGTSTNAGKITKLEKLNAGETATITDENGTATKYYAKSDTLIWKTDSEGTVTVASISQNGDVLAVADNDWEPTSPLTQAFSWTDATTDADGVGYFLVDAAGNATIADTAADKVIATYKDVGNRLVKATYTRSTAATNPGKLEIATTEAVSKTGLAETASGTPALKTLNVNVSGGEPVVLTKVAGVAMNVTGAGNGSVFTSFVDGDTVTTASLNAKAKEKVTFGTTDFVAGADGVMTFTGGGYIVDATILATNTSVQTNTVTDDETKVQTTTVYKYTAGSAESADKDGVIVTFDDGVISSVSGLGDGESFNFVKTVKAKDGTATETDTTYSAVKSGSVYEVTKTVVENGATTMYTQNFQNLSQNVLKETGWLVKSQTLSSQFDFGDLTTNGNTAVGYFVASGSAEYTATVKKQDSDQPVKHGTYVEVKASMAATGIRTIESIRLVDVSEKGVVTEATTKKLGTVKMTLEDGYIVALPATHAALEITATKGTLTNVSAEDVVKGTLATANDVISINGVSYKAVENNTAFEIAGGKVETGSFYVKETAFTATNGDTVKVDAASADGVKVTFTSGEIGTIKDLDNGETVTVTSGDDTTTYTYDGSTVTKTVKSGGVTETWTKTGQIQDSDDVVGLTYTTTSKFDWPTTETPTTYGYFKFSTNATTIEKQTSPANVNPSNKQYARVQVTGDAATGYTITSVEFAGAAAIGTTSTPEYTISIATVPGSITLEANAVDLSEAAEGAVRNFKFNITNAAKGQTFSGLSAVDSVATGTLYTGESITVNGVEYIANINGTMTINGDGTAKAGTFTLKTGGKILVADGTKGSDGIEGDLTIVAGTATEAKVQVTGNDLTSVSQLGDGETVTITAVKDGVTTVTKLSAEQDSADDPVTITKTVTVDGVATTYSGTADNLGVNLLSDVKYAVSGASIVSYLNWTDAESTGYFKLTVNEAGTALSEAVHVAAEAKQTTLKVEEGDIYLKVSTVKSGDTVTITAIEPQEVQADGTLAKTNAITAGTVNLTAPTGTAIVLNTTSMGLDLPVAVNVTGAAKGSSITMNQGDTLETATLEENGKVEVNGQTFTAAKAAALKFAGNALSSGAVKMVTTGTAPVSITASGADGKVNTDDVTVTFTPAFAVETTGEAPVVTVANGVVTGISGMKTDGSKVATVADGVTLTYTYDWTSAQLNAAVSGTMSDGKTFSTIALAKDAELSNVAGLGDSGTLVSGAADNVITIVSNGTNSSVKSGVLAMNGTVIATGGTKVVGTTGTATIVDGKLTNLSGATSVTVTEYSSVTAGDPAVTTYTATVTSYTVKGTTVTKTVKVGTSTVSEAAAETAAASDAGKASAGFLASGGDVLSASYVSTSEETVTEEALGQFSWQGINGRSTGYFTLAEKKAASGTTYSTTVKEQDKEQGATTANGKTTKYLVANLSDMKALSFAAVEVKSELVDSTAKTYNVTKKALDITSSTFAGSTITITAPTDQAINYDKGTGNTAAAFGVVINKLAADSEVSNLDSGDKVTTNTLDIGKFVTMDSTVYTAGAKGTLVFVGEGNNAPETGDPTNKSALLTGTIKLADGTAYRLAGAAESKDEGSTTNDITVRYDKSSDATDVILKASNGAVTSITGLANENDTVTVTNSSGTVRNGTETIELAAGNVIVYEVLANQMIQRTIYNADTNESDSISTSDKPTAIGFVTLAKAGAEIYSAAYKEAEGTPVSSLSFDDTVANTTVGYVSLGTTDSDGSTSVMELGTNKNIGSVDSGKASGEGDLIIEPSIEGGTTFAADPGKYYLRVQASTTKATDTKDGVTTIKSVDVMKASATGALSTVKATEAVYTGKLTIDGTKFKDDDTTTYAVLNYTLPKSRTWQLVVTDAAIGSTFTNLVAGEKGDQVTTADTTGYALKGTVTLYKATTANDGKLVTATQKVTTTGDGVTINTEDGVVSAIKNFATNGETVTLVTNSATEGTVTTVYKATVDKTTGNLTVTKTETAESGAKTVSIGSVAKADIDETKDILNTNYITYTKDNSQNTVVSKFDWTMNNSSTGYFVAKSGKATVGIGNATIGKGQAANRYIAVAISANGVVSAITQQKFDTTTMAMADVTDEAELFEGTITVKAPTAYALTLSRDALGDGIDLEAESDGTYKAALAITGAITGSKLSKLVNGDTVTTGRLAKDTGKVRVNDSLFTAGAASALGFKIQSDTTTLTSGTLALANDAAIKANTEGTDLVYIYDGSETVAIQAGEGTGITVLAKTDAKGITTFTIGDLGENETFTVGDVTYKKSGATLLRVYSAKDVEGNLTEVQEVYAIGSNKTVTSAILSIENTKNWKEVEATFTEQADGAQKSNFGTVTTKLSLADSYIAAAKKNNANYLAEAQAVGGIKNAFVVDTYLAKGTSTRGIAASVVADKAEWQTAVGEISITADSNGVYTYSYEANEKIAQTITVSKGWNVAASDQGDTITGASSGTNAITGGAGNDSITAGGAGETFFFDFDSGNGRDELKGYMAGKDTINITGDFAVQLDTVSGGNVFLFSDDDSDGIYDSEEEGVRLMAVQGKAVSIGDSTYYFGNGALSGNNTKPTAGTTFTYVEKAYYVGNESGKNTLKVTTDKSKASKTTLGDTVTVSLADTDHYKNITTLDGASSANKMVLAAGDSVGTSYVLKGGSYQTSLAGGVGNDMLTGGSGEDVFWFESGLSGSDTVKSYVSGKDAVYLGALADDEDLETKSVEISAEKTAVVLSQGKNTVTIEGAASTTKALNISKDGTSTNTVSYYVANSTAKTNTFTATVGTDATTDDTNKIALTSYYVGGTNATDTLKIANTAANKKGKVTASVSLAALTGEGKLKSIETLDVSGLASAKDSKVTVQGADSGTFTLVGSTSANVMETFDLSNFTAGSATIKNLSVKDVIDLGSAEISSIGKYSSTGTEITLNNGAKVNVVGMTRNTHDNIHVGDTTISYKK